VWEEVGEGEVEVPEGESEEDILSVEGEAVLCNF
jgi:hypothetical protein